MRNPEFLNKVEDIYRDGEKTTLNIKSIPEFDKLQYDLLDEKDFVKYLRDIERVVRNSFEYRQCIQYLKGMGMDECSFLEGVTCRDNTKVRIELHHEPYTLYDIVSTVHKKREKMKQDTRVAAVAQEVIWLHYVGWVGLTPLSQTVHELVHNQYLFVPINTVRGAFDLFTTNYYNYIDPDLLDYVDCSKEMLNNEKAIQKQMEILNSHDIYINTSETIEGLLTRQDIVNMVKNRIDEIKNNKRVMARIVY